MFLSTTSEFILLFKMLFLVFYENVLDNYMELFMISFVTDMSISGCCKHLSRKEETAVTFWFTKQIEIWLCHSVLTPFEFTFIFTKLIDMLNLLVRGPYLVVTLEILLDWWLIRKYLHFPTQYFTHKYILSIICSCKFDYCKTKLWKLVSNFGRSSIYNISPRVVIYAIIVNNLTGMTTVE